jgi:transposase
MIEGISERAAAERFGINARTVSKMLKFSVNAGVNLQQFSGVKVQHGRRQEGSRYIGGLLA